MIWLKKIWQDPVLSKVIAAGAITFLTYVAGLWPILYTLFLRLLSYLAIPISIPLWLLIILMPSLIFLLPCIHLFFPDGGPSFVEYTSDFLFSIRWNWEWQEPDMFNDKYRIKNLLPRCPKCSAALDLNSFRRNHTTRCINEQCDWSWNPPQTSIYERNWDLETKVKNEIERKIYVNNFE